MRDGPTDKERGRFEALSRLLATLQSENVPRLAAYFLATVLMSGVLVYVIERGRNPHFHSVEDGLWWSVVTLTTVGYGDIYPMTRAGRVLAFFVLLLGIGVVGVVTGKIASALVERRIKEGRGLTGAHKMKGHFVVLGWKSDIPLLVQGLLDAHRTLGPEHLVLVNTAGEMANEDLRGRFPGLVYIHGDPIDTAVLKRARLADAAKVLILADESGERTDPERDARTVMIALSIENVAPDIYTCAEVLDRKYVEYLKLAHCDEVILSREYGRFLLVGASASAGLSSVLHDLLDFADARSLSTMRVPSALVGRTFGELQAHLRRSSGALAIGLLENTGRPRAMKREALRAAQKTENVATLLENLRQVKDLVPNKPVLNPPDDYEIAAHALAIVIGAARAAQAGVPS
jgi:voltage-gated potassium channel